MRLELVFDEGLDCLLIWDHPCDYCLLLLRKQASQWRHKFILVFVKMLDFFDLACVDVFEFDPWFVPEVENIVVEPLAFKEQPFKLLFLFLAQALLNNLQLIDFDIHSSMPSKRLLLCQADSCFLHVRACWSKVIRCHQAYLLLPMQVFAYCSYLIILAIHATPWRDVTFLARDVNTWTQRWQSIT